MTNISCTLIFHPISKTESQYSKICSYKEAKHHGIWDIRRAENRENYKQGIKTVQRIYKSLQIQNITFCKSFNWISTFQRQKRKESVRMRTSVNILLLYKLCGVQMLEEEGIVTGYWQTRCSRGCPTNSVLINLWTH